MKVLIVESRVELATLWARHMERMGVAVVCAGSQEEAVDLMAREMPDIILLDLVLREGSALAVADFASYRLPNTRVIFVSDSSFFSDGSIFAHASNACAFVPSSTRPDDLAAMVEHYGVT